MHCRDQEVLTKTYALTASTNCTLTTQIYRQYYSAMSKLLVIFGATGNSGSSVLNFVLNDAELSKEYKIRAITRDPNSAAGKALTAKGVEVVGANPDDPATVEPALQGAHTVYAMSFPRYDVGPEAHLEIKQGKLMVDTAVKVGAQYFIWMTLPHVTELTKGKYTKVVGFDDKAHVEDYIRKQPIKSAFFSPASFMQNYASMMKPRPNGDGTYSLGRLQSANTPLPLIDITGDTGKFVGAILANPDKYEGKTFCAATKSYTIQEQADIMSKATGKTIKYFQMSEEMSRKVFPPNAADGLIQMMQYQEEFGYYGPDTDKLVQWAVDNARGSPNTFEEYLRQNPLQLD